MSHNDDILIEVKGVSKKFSRSLRRSMWYGLKDVGSALLGIKTNRTSLREGEFWAVKDVSFSLRRGECLGVIGHNGAGKSTLLKMLNGLIRPDGGSITMRGKVNALIELGAGFNPLLTGRENIYVNGQLLGFSRNEINEKLPSILDFAELGEFIDSPVQNYSSGMKVRLGFAIAAQMEPDVLLIDEVLAVGDLGFVLKCFNVIDNLLQKAAVIFVSHGMPQVSRVCSNIMFLEKGNSVFQGNDVAKGIDLYYASFNHNAERNVIYNRDNDAVFLDLVFDGEAMDDGMIYALNRLEDLNMVIKIGVKKAFEHPFLTIIIHDKEQRPVGMCRTESGLTMENRYDADDQYDYYQIKLSLPRINLSKGLYSLSLGISEAIVALPMLRIQSIKRFQVYSKHNIWPPIEFDANWY